MSDPLCDLPQLLCRCSTHIWYILLKRKDDLYDIPYLLLCDGNFEVSFATRPFQNTREGASKLYFEKVFLQGESFRQIRII